MKITSSVWLQNKCFGSMYVCVTMTIESSTKQSDNKSNPNPTTKDHATVNIQLNTATCSLSPL